MMEHAQMKVQNPSTYLLLPSSWITDGKEAKKHKKYSEWFWHMAIPVIVVGGSYFC